MKSRSLEFVQGSGVPFAAWAFGTAIMVFAAALRGLSPADPAAWIRWDSSIYLDIAARGYRLIHEMHFLNGRTLEWSGNCVSFPLYPWLIRAAIALGAAPRPAGVALAWLFHFLALAALWNAFLAREKKEPALLLIACPPSFRARFTSPRSSPRCASC